jgi:hypothetical protein
MGHLLIGGLSVYYCTSFLVVRAILEQSNSHFKGFVQVTPHFKPRILKLFTVVFCVKKL